MYQQRTVLLLCLGISALFLSIEAIKDRGYGENEIIFENTCGDEDSQQELRRGIALLHSFFYDAATDTFEGLVDSVGVESCPMAVWGTAMSQVHFLWEPVSEETMKKMRLRLLDAAEKCGTSTKALPIECDYVNAGLEFYQDSPPSYQHRVNGYHAAFSKLVDKYDNDVETANFFGLMEVVKAGGEGGEAMLKRQRRALAKMEVILVDHPEHMGTLHYVVHACDNPALAKLARDHALQYAAVAPDVPHALHMPSHIFTILGMWKNSIDTNERGVHYAEEYVKNKLGKGPRVWHEEKCHSMKFITVAKLQYGQVAEVEDIVNNVFAVEGTVGGETAAAGLESIPPRFYVETRDWRAAADYEAPYYRLPIFKEIIYWPVYRDYVRVIAHVMLGENDKASEALTRLIAKYDELKGNGYFDDRLAYWIEWFNSLRDVAEAYVLISSPDTIESGLAKMRTVVDRYDPNTPEVATMDLIPRYEQYGDMLTMLGRHEEALSAYQEQLKNSPNRFNLLYSLAHTSEVLGDHRNAFVHYKALIVLCEGKDVERSELKHAISYVSAYEEAGNLAASSLAEQTSHETATLSVYTTSNENRAPSSRGGYGFMVLPMAIVAVAGLALGVVVIMKRRRSQHSPMMYANLQVSTV